MQFVRYGYEKSKITIKDNLIRLSMGNIGKMLNAKMANKLIIQLLAIFWVPEPGSNNENADCCLSHAWILSQV